MPKQPDQADDKIHEDQLLNFLVNTLTGAFGLNLGANAEIDPEDIYEILVGATADGTSISMLCKRSEDAPPGTDVLYHFRTKPTLTASKRSATRCSKSTRSLSFPSRWRSPSISTFDPTTGTNRRQRASTIAKPRRALRPSTSTRRSTHAYETNGTHWRYAVSPSVMNGTTGLMATLAKYVTKNASVQSTSTVSRYYHLMGIVATDGCSNRDGLSVVKAATGDQ